MPGQNDIVSDLLVAIEAIEATGQAPLRVLTVADIESTNRESRDQRHKQRDEYMGQRYLNSVISGRVY